MVCRLPTILSDNRQKRLRGNCLGLSVVVSVHRLRDGERDLQLVWASKEGGSSALAAPVMHDRHSRRTSLRIPSHQYLRASIPNNPFSAKWPENLPLRFDQEHGPQSLWNCNSNPVRWPWIDITQYSVQQVEPRTRHHDLSGFKLVCR